MVWFERKATLSLQLLFRVVSEASHEGWFCVPLSFDFLRDHIPSYGELTFRISAMQAQYMKCKAREKAWAKATNISV